MTEHLPECFASLCECDDTHFKSIDCDFNCICPSLRACEQRVKEKYADVPAIWNDGFEHGLYAARKAVGDLPHPMIDVECECGACAALAAIDALREVEK